MKKIGTKGDMAYQKYACLLLLGLLASSVVADPTDSLEGVEDLGEAVSYCLSYHPSPPFVLVDMPSGL